MSVEQLALQPKELDLVKKDGDEQKEQLAPLKMLMTGQMGAGKDFIALHLRREHGAVSWSRTELMKRMAHAVADGLGDADEILSKLFSAEDERSEVLAELLTYLQSYDPEPGKPRRLYQDLTQICMDHDPLVFERELAERIDSIGDVPFSLIADVRALEAFQFFTERGYITVRVEADKSVRRERMKRRDGYLPSEETFNHPSETVMNNVPHNYTIDNSGDDAAELYARVDALLEHIRAEQKEGAQRLLASTSS